MADRIVSPNDSISQDNNSTVAPSEKHLEQWIVNHPHLCMEVVGEPDDKWDGADHFIDKIVKQQVRMPSGICDLVAIVPRYTIKSLCAIELKKGVINSDTVAQCLRYVRDLRHILLETLRSGERTPVYPPSSISDQLLGYPQEITGMVIGHSIADHNLLIACEATGIVVLTYQYIGGQYTFESHTDGNYQERYPHYENFAHGAIGEALRAVMQSRSEVENK